MIKGYDKRHGGPYDRGEADAWYRRPCVPHYFKEDTYSSELVELDRMTPEEIEEYRVGWMNGMLSGEHKE